MSHSNNELRAFLKSEWSGQGGLAQNAITQGVSPSPTLKELLPSVPGPSQSGQLPLGVLPAPEESPVIRRFKPPFDNTTKHDARGDAISICYDFLIQRRVPIWASHLIAYEFIDRPEVQEKFQVGNYKLENDDDYEKIHAFAWCRDLIQQFNQFMIELSNEEHELPVKPAQYDKWPISFSATKNKRPKMEDRHIIVPTFACIEPKKDNQSIEDLAFFAVFDGHNGHEVAGYLSSHFHRSFLESCNKSPDPMEYLKNTYDYTDKLLNLRCEKEKYRGGSTAVGVLISDNSLYMFYCGDASIGIFTDSSIRTLSQPHIPSNEQEYNRVIANGGTIVNVGGELRVNGVLNITRSMGELLGKPMISAEPEMDKYELTERDYLLFVASDGVWDELSTVDIRNHCVNFAKKYPSDHYVHLADYIVADCKISGRDNMTLIVVFLKSIDEVWTHLCNLPENKQPS